MTTDRMLAALLLVVALGAIGWFLRGDRAEYRRFKALADTASRRRRYRRWTEKLWLAFALPPLVGLALLGRLGALAALPPEFAPAAALLPHADPEAVRAMVTGASIGLFGGALATVVVTAIARRRGRAAKVPQLGDTNALLPRNRGELGWTALLSVSAGVTEELAFRLFLPLLLAIVTGSALAGFVAAALIFGAMHLYQGWVGVLATTFLGALLSVVYLFTGALWLAMLLHALIDLMGLVVRPLLTGAWRVEPVSPDAAEMA